MVKRTISSYGRMGHTNSITMAFGVIPRISIGTIFGMMLTMPTPDTTLLCYRIYLCWDPETETAAYYTAEYDKYDGFFDEGCLICGWSPDGSHHYYLEGKILPGSEDPEYEKALAEEAETVLELMRGRTDALVLDPDHYLGDHRTV